jgi:alpha-amylase
MDSTLNFPMYFTLREVFMQRHTMWKLEMREEQNKQYFRDISLLGNFVDNHDVKRFLNEQRDSTLLRNALTYIFMADGIPILYQGIIYNTNQAPV